MDGVTEYLVQACIENGANPNIQDIYGRTPLHMAATSGNTVALSALLKYHQNLGCLNLDLQTIGGETPLIKATMFCKTDSLSLLLAAGANTQLLTAEGETVYTLAVKM